jgi:hypothetical protein
MMPDRHTPLSGDVAHQIAGRYRLRDRLGRALRMVEYEPTARLLRSHLDRSIEWNEVKARDSLDELLAGLSVLHIGGLDDDGTLHRLGLDAQGIVELLQHRDVARYFESYYPYAPPILFRESQLGGTAQEYVQYLGKERQRPEWRIAFDRFLLLDAAFNATGALQDFLGILDDYTIGDFDLADLEVAFRDERRMRRFLGQMMGRRLVQGLQDFIEFSDDLASFLKECEDLPLFRGLVWLNYGYWYGAGGERMREVTRWLTGTLQKVALEAVDSAGPDSDRTFRLAIIMDSLTDLDGFPREILQACGKQLHRWSYHVGARRDNMTERHQ